MAKPLVAGLLNFCAAATQRRKPSVAESTNLFSGALACVPEQQIAANQMWRDLVTCAPEQRCTLINLWELELVSIGCSQVLENAILNPTA